MLRRAFFFCSALVFAALVIASPISAVQADPTPGRPIAPAAPPEILPATQSYSIFLPMMGRSKPVVVLPTKKGLGMPYADCDGVAKLGASWVYDWSANPPNCAGAEQVPMLWGAGSVNSTPTGSSAWLLGFNEPDLSSQSNISVARAVPLWRTVEQKFSQWKLVAPAPSHLNPTWIVDFRNAYIEEYKTAPRLDALGVHCYLWTAGECIQMAKQYVAWARAWGIREIWVTEFAFPTCGDRRSVDDSLREGQSFMNWLENEPMVTRYAWFASRIQGNEVWATGICDAPLLDWTTREPSAYGRLYASTR